MKNVYKNGWTKNKVIKHIELNFKGKAYNKKNSICQYKTKSGKKCAVGLFIPNGHKGEKHHGEVDSLLAEHPNLQKYMPMNEVVLSQLQRIHDCGDHYVADDPRSDDEVLMDMISFIESLG